MGNIFNKDFIDFLKALNECEVEYILVGGYAVILHGYNRTTGDLDVWVKPTDSNYSKLMNSFLKFGLPIIAISKESFLNTTDFDVFTFGRSPVSIDIMTKVKGLDFDPVMKDSIDYETDGIRIKVVSYKELIKSKTASGRYKDMDDILHLKKN